MSVIDLQPILKVIANGKGTPFFFVPEMLSYLEIMENQKQSALLGKNFVEALNKLRDSVVSSDEYYLRGVNLCNVILSLSDAITDSTNHVMIGNKENLSKIHTEIITEKVYQVMAVVEIIREMFQHKDFATLEDLIYFAGNKDEFEIPEYSAFSAIKDYHAMIDGYIETINIQNETISRLLGTSDNANSDE